MFKMLIFTSALIFNACVGRVVYKSVYIPVKCDIHYPSRPNSDLDLLTYLKELLIYTEQLESDLKHCSTSEAEQAPTQETPTNNTSTPDKD